MFFPVEYSKKEKAHCNQCTFNISYQDVCICFLGRFQKEVINLGILALCRDFYGIMIDVNYVYKYQYKSEVFYDAGKIGK